jgi:hypothetical protein
VQRPRAAARATGIPGEFVAGVRFRAWSPPSALHPTIGVHAPLVFDLVDRWAGARSAAARTTCRIRAGATTTRSRSTPTKPKRAASRGSGARTHAGADALPTSRESATPTTLDLRWQPRRMMTDIRTGSRRARRVSCIWAAPHGAVRVGLRAPHAGVHPAHRGHRRRALDAGSRAGDPRRDGVARLDYDEGPFYQMQRMDRYRRSARHATAGLAYRCYMQPAELDELRAAQMARGEKPRYDGRWRPENAAGKAPPEGIAPVIRFKNPLTGSVAWDDRIKGRIEIANAELDDLVLARPDGTPTYNFCVVVDDIDMRITHVVRGDDHVNNTPRQINIFRALGAEPPVFAHVPTVLGEDGHKLSKRHGAVSVMQYEEEGYLPDAMVNFLARLGWAHGDDEVFTREEFVAWFDWSTSARRRRASIRQAQVGEPGAHEAAAGASSGAARAVPRARGLDPAGSHARRWPAAARSRRDARRNGGRGALLSTRRRHAPRCRDQARDNEAAHCRSSRRVATLRGRARRSAPQ